MGRCEKVFCKTGKEFSIRITTPDYPTILQPKQGLSGDMEGNQGLQE